MQVTELNTDGLKREFKVVIGSADIQSRVNGRLDEIARTVAFLLDAGMGYLTGQVLHVKGGPYLPG